jgi:O-antigen ligase
MIKYARSIKPGDAELQTKLKSLRGDNPDIPRFQVFRPKFAAYGNSFVIRFHGSARGQAAELSAAGVDLLYDNVGLSPTNTVPRLRSFPRNALTYAGVSAALLPFAFYLAWAAAGRRRLIGQVGVAACLFGAAFSLARGAWVAIALGTIYLVVDGLVSRQMKMRFVLALVAAAVVLTGVFLVKYDVDPLRGRAGGGASVSTRDDLYKDTLSILQVNPKYIALGYGTEQPRTESGTVKDGARYVPRAGTHSTYLNYLFRTGLPGGLAIIGLYLLALLHARAASRDRTDEERIFATSATAAMVIAAAHAAILSLYVEPIYTLVISLVVGAAMAGAVQLHRPIWPWHKTEAQ